MNRAFFLIAITALFVAPNCLAEKAMASANSFCKAYSQFARVVMTERQNGGSMAKLMDMDMSRMGENADIAQRVIIEAFEEPRWETQERKRNAIVDFENQAHLVCVKLQLGAKQ